MLSSGNRALVAMNSFIALVFATALIFLAFVANSELFCSLSPSRLIRSCCFVLCKTADLKGKYKDCRLTNSFVG